jgi:DNA-binding transcriptional regulator YhcF (GntR family)
MSMTMFTQISASSKTPKYQQLVNALLSDIESGVLKVGDRLPSINEASEECYLSRDTVERAYAELHRLGVITSIFRKGYFITGKNTRMRTKVFFMVGKMTEANQRVLNALTQVLGKHAIIDVFTHTYKDEHFREIINSHLGNYHYYVIMPQLIEDESENHKTLKKISGERLILLDSPFKTFPGNHSDFYTDVQTQIGEVMNGALGVLKKYHTLSLVLPSEDYFDADWLKGLRNFAEKHSFDFQVLDSMEEEEIQEGQVYLTMDDCDMVQVIKQCRAHHWQLGQQVGLISFGETCYKEILEGGISTLSTNVTELATWIHEAIQENKRLNQVIHYQLNQRSSI